MNGTRVWMTHPGIDGVCPTTMDQFTNLWQSKGWELASAPGAAQRAAGTFIQDTAPPSPVKYDVWLDLATDTQKWWNGTAWEVIGGSGAGNVITITEAPPNVRQHYQGGDVDYTAAFQRLFASGVNTAYVPPSATAYGISMGLVMPYTMSLELDPGATVQAVSPLAAPILTVGDTTNRWSFKHLQGGVWDCNDNAAGIVVLASRSSILREVKVNDSTGHFITGGDSNNPGTTNGLRIQDCFTDRDPASNVPVGSYGIWILGADCHVMHTTIVGAETSFRNDGTGNRFVDCHGWGWTGHLPITIFDSNGFDVDWVACKADSPSQYGWYIRKLGWRITGGEVLNGPSAVDGVIGVHIDSDKMWNPQGSMIGLNFNGSLTHSIAVDYDGVVPATSLTAVGCVPFNVTTANLGKQDFLRGRSGSQSHVQTANTLPGATHSWTFILADDEIPTFYAGRTYQLGIVARDGSNNTRWTMNGQVLVYQDASANGVNIVLCDVTNKLGTAFASGLANGTFGLTLGVDSTGLQITVNIQNNTANNVQFGIKLT
jgi:hypothetical protein